MIGRTCRGRFHFFANLEIFSDFALGSSLAALAAGNISAQAIIDPMIKITRLVKNPENPSDARHIIDASTNTTAKVI